MKKIIFLILLSSCFVRKTEVGFIIDGKLLHGNYTRTLLNNKLVIWYKGSMLFIEADSIYPFRKKQY